MTDLAAACVRCVMSAIKGVSDFIFNTDYPGLTLSIGAVLVGLLLIDLGWNYFDYFVSSSGSHVRSGSGADKK